MVDYDSASRRGEPFAILIRAHKLLPNPYKRICTADLKVETAARFARTGLRHDAQPAHSPPTSGDPAR